MSDQHAAETNLAADFDRDLAAVNAVRNGYQVSDSNKVLLAFIDNLWREYSNQAQRMAELEQALRRIVFEGDMTAPEGMLRIARDAIGPRPTTPPPATLHDPNEGPIDNRGVVVLPDGSGVLPAFYNQWKCSQCGRDPQDVKFNGCGYSQPCGRLAAHETVPPR